MQMLLFLMVFNVLSSVSLTCWLLFARLELNKGIGLETVHYLNDGLWHMKAVKWLCFRYIEYLSVWIQVIHTVSHPSVSNVMQLLLQFSVGMLLKITFDIPEFLYNVLPLVQLKLLSQLKRLQLYLFMKRSRFPV